MKPRRAKKAVVNLKVQSEILRELSDGKSMIRCGHPPYSDLANPLLIISDRDGFWVRSVDVKTFIDLIENGSIDNLEGGTVYTITNTGRSNVLDN